MFRTKVPKRSLFQKSKILLGNVLIPLSISWSFDKSPYRWLRSATFRTSFLKVHAFSIAMCVCLVSNLCCEGECTHWTLCACGRRYSSFKLRPLLSVLILHSVFEATLLWRSYLITWNLPSSIWKRRRSSLLSTRRMWPLRMVKFPRH